MPVLRRGGLGGRARRIALLAVAALMAWGGLAFAAALPVGLQNGSFESGLDGWTAQTLRPNAEGGYDVFPSGCVPDSKTSICAVGADEFQVTSVDDETGEEETFMQRVEPLDGVKMARMAGPFNDAGQVQVEERYQLLQSFTVDPANPVIELNYNVSTFDYTGFDELRFTVVLLDAATGQEIATFAQGGYGASGDTRYKNTGWQSSYIDLTGFENQEVELVIDSGGTQDTLYGFWSYVDAGQAPAAPVGSPGFSVPTRPDGQPVDFTSYPGGANQQWLTIPNGQVAEFENGCLGPITISVPIDPGSAQISEVELVVVPRDGGPADVSEMTGEGNVWSAQIPCALTADLFVKYRLDEEGAVEYFTVPIGGITLIDPQGVVYDRARFDAEKAAGATDEQARAAAAIEGATVRLQRRNANGDFYNVLSGDPGIHPKINPEITGPNGLYQWDVSEGTYRVLVSKEGYTSVISQAVDIPPPVLDLHIAMESTTQPQPVDRDGDGVPDGSDQCPDISAGTASGCPEAPADGDADGVPDASDQCPALAGNLPNGCLNDAAGQKKGPCAAKTGTRLAVCLKAQKGLKKCKSVKKKKARKLCRKRARAIARCEAKSTSKAKRRCVRKARRIGRVKRAAKAGR